MCCLAIALANEVEVGLFWQAFFQHIEVRHQQAGDFFARYSEDVQHRVLRVDHAGGRDQGEFLDPMAMLGSEFRGQVPAEREPDQVEAIEAELIE